MEERKIRIENFDFLLNPNQKIIGLVLEDDEMFSLILKPGIVKNE